MAYLFADSSSRARDGNGEPYATKCFEGALASQPRIHKLICGHEIETFNEKERCGANCAPAAHADSKVKEPAFACPILNCAQDRRSLTERNKVFLPKPGQGRTRFRRCELRQDPLVGAKHSSSRRKYRTRVDNHQPRKRSASPYRPQRVYTGEDIEPADGPKSSSRSTRNRQPRKRSASPYRPQRVYTGEDVDPDDGPKSSSRSTRNRQPRKRSASPNRPQRVNAGEDVDPAEVLNALAASDEGYRIVLESFTGPGVRPKKDGRYKTRKDWEDEVKDKLVARALDNFRVVDSTEFRQQLGKARRQALASDPDFGGGDKEFGEEIGKTEAEDRIGLDIDTGLDCSVCGNRAVGVAFKCTLCVEFVFCNTCMLVKRDRHPKNKHHKFDRIQPSIGLDLVADEQMGDTYKAAEVPYEPASFCKCETTSKRYLVACDGDDCNTRFHPGCFGRGLFEDNMYELDDGEYYLRKDYNAAKSGRSFMCEACHHAAPVVESEHPMITRAKVRMGEAKKKVYSKQEEAAKNAELKLAKTEEERMAIEAKWEEIADEEMEDVGQEEPASDIPPQAWFMGPMVFRSKPQ